MEKDLIEIRTRLNNAIFEKFNSFYYAAKAVNKSPSFFYGYRNLQSIDSINDMCKTADISLEYILTGKHKGKYKPIKPTFSGLLKLYTTHKGEHTSAETQTIFRIKHGSSRIGLSVLSNLSTKYNFSIYELIKWQ